MTLGEGRLSAGGTHGATVNAVLASPGVVFLLLWTVAALEVCRGASFAGRDRQLDVESDPDHSNGEADSESDQEITTTEHYPLTVNDAQRTGPVAADLRTHFGEDRVAELTAPVSASEDFGSFGTEWGVPSVFWYVGGTDPDSYRAAKAAGRIAQDISTNHNPAFAPVLHPTLETGIQAMVVSALDALGA